MATDHLPDGNEPANTSEGGPPPLQSLRFIGPVTADTLESLDIDSADIRAKNVSYSLLLDYGVNPGVAGKIRREHSLPWSFDHTDGETLRRRASHINGLREDERAWIDSGPSDS